MRRVFILLTLSLMFCGLTAFAQGEVEAPKSCKQCGMDRTMFAHSRMQVAYADGSSTGTCSVHCAAVEVRQNPTRKLTTLRVADYQTRALIDARSAVWVIGGDKGGVMTELAKWAFATHAEAESFRKLHGGKLAGFDEVWAMAEKEQD